VVWAISIVRIVYSVPSVVAVITDPVHIARSIVHCIFVRTVMTIASRATNATHDRNHTTACFGEISPFTDHPNLNWIHLRSTFSTRRKWVLVLVNVFVSLVAVINVPTVLVALYNVTSGLYVPTSGKYYFAPTAALLDGI
jgi:hypothetical protein